MGERRCVVLPPRPGDRERDAPAKVQAGVPDLPARGPAPAQQHGAGGEMAAPDPAAPPAPLAPQRLAGAQPVCAVPHEGPHDPALDQARAQAGQAREAVEQVCQVHVYGRGGRGHAPPAWG